MKVENAYTKVFTEFDFQHLSDQSFYAAVFFSDLKHRWQSITKGNMVALEFDLIWRPSPVSVISSISLPDFLTSVKLVNEALSGWSKDNQQLEEFVVIPLQEAYYDSNFDFFALSGNDSKMAQILQFIDFIDVHLAAISKQQVTRKSSIHKNVWRIESTISIP